MYEIIMKILTPNDFDKYKNKIIDYLVNEANMEYYYPNIKQWYYNKVTKDVYSHKREIILLLHDDKIVGISIIRFKPAKICTFYISENYRGRYLGDMLMEYSIYRIEEISGKCDIIITVPEEKVM